MHINFKYFIVSIGSIFLALGIGILIGSNIVTNETIQKENAAIIDDIDKQFEALQKKDDKLVAENKELTSNINNYKKYIEENEESLVKDTLSGKKVGIISFNEKENSDNLKNTLGLSGATTSFNIVITEKVFEKQALEALGLEDDKEVISFISEAIQNPENASRLATLSELGLIKYDNMAIPFKDVDNIIVFKNTNTTMKDKVNKMEIPFIESIRGTKPVVVVSNSNSNKEGMEEINRLKLATINNVDQPLGHIALNMVLLNDKLIGAYGIMEGNIVAIPTVK